MQRLFLAGLLSAMALMAQPQGPDAGQAQPQDDPPSRVARLNWISGDVAFQPATVDSWTNATLNYPLTTGDHLFVNPGGRAELHIDDSAIRLNSNSNFGFLNLDDDIVQISLNEGSVGIRLRQLDPNDAWEIDTPNGAVTLKGAGEYRIDTDPDRNVTLVTVRSGQAEMYQDGNSLLITPHQTVRFSDSGQEVNAESPADDFDGFAASRDRAEDALPHGDYVPDTMIGSEDLYAYGRWTSDPLYGSIWFPPVDAGWSPYSAGRWVFVEPWGWTWVDEAPWGFAPFHYGRWVTVHGSWAWLPGARTHRPVYAPALVGFVGGSGFEASVGWFPLGPGEPWIPAWGASRTYIERVNIRYVTNVAAIRVTDIHYVNRGSVTVVSQSDFASARPVRGVAIRYSPAQLRDAQVIGYGPRIAPVRDGVLAGSQRGAPRTPARAVVARTPPPPAPVSFDARRPLLEENHGQPLRANQVGQLRNQQPAAVVARPAVRAIGGPQGNRQAAPVIRNRAPQPPPQRAEPARPAGRGALQPRTTGQRWAGARPTAGRKGRSEPKDEKRDEKR